MVAMGWELYAELRAVIEGGVDAGRGVNRERWLEGR